MPTLLFAGWDRLAPYHTPKTSKRQLPNIGFSAAADAICRSKHRGPQSQFVWTPKLARAPESPNRFQRAHDRISTQLTLQQQSAIEDSVCISSRNRNGHPTTPVVRRCNKPRATALQTPRNSQGYQLDTNVDLGRLVRDMPQLRDLVQSREMDVRS